MIIEKNPSFVVLVPGVQNGDLSNIGRHTVLDQLRSRWPNYDDVSVSIFSNVVTYFNDQISKQPTPWQT